MMSLDSIDVVLTFLPRINTAGKSRVAVNDEARALIQAVTVNGFSEQTSALPDKASQSAIDI
jgi:hypothetical protein